MATISISQLDTATQAKVDDLYEVAVVDANSQTGYASRKLTAAQIATLIAQGVQFSGLSTEAKTIIAAINEAAQNGGTEVEANPTGEPTDTLQKIGIDGTIYEVGGSEPVSKTVTGNPIHIEDAADAPIVSGTVTFEPVQDLHGYDKPWAGGVGVNKWDEQWEQGGINTADGTNQGASCIRSVNYIPVSSDSYYFYMGTDAQLYVYAYDENKTYIGTYYNGSYVKTGSVTNVRGTAITFPLNVKFIRFRTNTAYGTTYNNDLAINYPSTATTYTPYSNICPIEGYTDCEIEVTGKNKLSMTVDVIKADNTTGTWSGNVYTLNGVTFTILTDDGGNVIGIKTNGTASNVARLSFKNLSFGDSNLILNGTPNGGSTSTYFQRISNNTVSSYFIDVGSGVTITDPSNMQILEILVTNGTNVDNLIFQPMIRLATETDPTFEPYSNIYTIDLDGTRYGGKVYPVTGKMSVSMGYIASYAGETIGEPWLSDRDEYVPGTTPSTGAEVVYTLASPTIVQLTPEQIRTLQGTNNISTNMTEMSLEYITQDYQPLVKLIERSAGHHYSTQERVIGTWIDGKTLYEKVFDIGNLPNNTTKLVAHDISNIDKVIRLTGFCDNGNGIYSELPMVSQSYPVALYIDGANINIKSSSNRTEYTGCAIIQYTKTTS